MVQIHPRVKDMLVAGIIRFSGVKCRQHISSQWEEIAELEREYKTRYPNPSAALDQLRPARTLYRAAGMEPTRIRPSSEALFRRVVKGKALYRINSIVDVCNYCSLAFFLPIGLYDLDKIKGEIEIRLGTEGEQYQGIGKDMIHLGNRLTLADDDGPFGNPSADSLRSSIELKSQNVLMVIFAPAGYSIEIMNAHLIFAKETMLKYHLEAICDGLEILPG